jgi:hypothetical protein
MRGSTIMQDLNDLIQRAYKKLKSSVYFDKTQLIQRNRIVQFESDDSKNIDARLDSISASLQDTEKWRLFEKEIINSINVLKLPKNLKTLNKDEDKNKIITNCKNDQLEIDDYQYFIDMSIAGQVIGVVWLLLIGVYLNDEIYPHSYGNRLRKKITNEEANHTTFSPYLFEPYFEQYESWRDTALNYAKKSLEKKQDVVILTLDFERYYYSVDLRQEDFECFYHKYLEAGNEKDDVVERINNFVYKVIQQYSILIDTVDDTLSESRNILPIGFLPSNVLANWCLKKFDDALINGWNPVYYGRYVDDLIIIDKVEKNSDIHILAKSGELDKDKFMEYYLTNCNTWLDKHSCEGEDKEKFALLKAETNGKNEKIYTVNMRYCSSENSKIRVQNGKVKVFYFNNKHTDALLTCFKTKITENKSEFRFLPEDEAVFQNDDYSEIYCIKESDTVNKFRGVDGIAIDKFALSKFLGKYLRIGGLVSDKAESRFKKDIEKIFTESILIDNYTSWEKTIEILVINEQFDAIEKLIKKIISALKQLDLSLQNSYRSGFSVTDCLLMVLHSAFCKAFSLVWGDNASKCIKKVIEIVHEYRNESFYEFSYVSILKQRQNYCSTRMTDKYIMPVLIEAYLKDDKCNLSDDEEMNLTKLANFTSHISDLKNVEYNYYPYMVTAFDISMYLTLFALSQGGDLSDLEDRINQEKILYAKFNYNLNEEKKSELSFYKMVEAEKIGSGDVYRLKVGNKINSKLRIAIANVELFSKNFKSVILDTPNRSYKRYKELSFIINQAIKENVDMLVMPESYVPFEWLPTIARTCAKNQLAIVTGVEHMKVHIVNGNTVKKKIYNLTAVILPFEDDDYKCAHINFHLKKYYAPKEEIEIKGYRYEPVCGKTYELYYWNDCWFPVYCCYELTSIKDRGIFQSYVDVLIAVEWNSDVNYYSNIIDSLSRDLHCYCIQVNSSNYGDSRITQPSQTESKDVIKTKGGKNSTILLDTIDLDKLRDFQLKEYSLQNSDKNFKPTPPNFNKETIVSKIKHKLWDELWDEFK